MLHFYQPTNLNLRSKLLFMQVLVSGDLQQRAAFSAKGLPDGVEVCFFAEGMDLPVADVFFDLSYEEKGASFPAITEQPVFVNAVIATAASLPPNAIRINAWSGFFERNHIEIASAGGQWMEKAEAILRQFNWSYTIAPDIPGMIAPRVIAMIINEAYFGLGDEISTRQEIDTAMKLGTNYPYGPFEWCEKIGSKKVCALLNRLKEENSLYAPAPLLITEADK